MKKLFIHYPLFRLLSPFATGVLVYLLILLVNNNVEQVKETFLGQELYVCIALAFIIQEFSRASLLLFDKFQMRLSALLSVLLQFFISISTSMFIVTLVMNFYYRKYLGYSPNFQELLIFNALFAFVTIIYTLLYKGHELLYKVNVQRLEVENQEIVSLGKEFEVFTLKINSDLLFESLDNLISIKDKPQLAEKFTDEFARLYRYQLLVRSSELLPIKEECDMLDVLINVYSHLRYRKVQLSYSFDSQELVIPGTLLNIIEKIIKSTICTSSKVLSIEIRSNDAFLEITHTPQERINQSISLVSLKGVAEKYAIYTDEALTIEEEGDLKIIKLPKLHIYESSDH